MSTSFDQVFDKDTAKEVFSLVHMDNLFIFLCKVIKPKPPTTTTTKTKRQKKNSKGKKKSVSSGPSVIPDQPLSIISFESVCYMKLSDCMFT